MSNTFKRATTLASWLAFAAVFAIAAPVLAQAPSQAQQNAIKSQCRSDYMAHCSSIPPGGEASLQCLEKNMSSLSPGCQSAVRAVEAPAAATAKPADTAAPKAAAPAATPKAAAPKAGAPKPTAAPAAATATAAAPASPTVMVLRPLRPREELLVLRSACSADVRTICGGVAPGGGRIVQCLATNAARLSPACTDVLSPFAAR